MPNPSSLTEAMMISQEGLPIFLIRPIRGFGLLSRTRIMAAPAPIARIRPSVNRKAYTLNREARTADGGNLLTYHGALRILL